MPVVSLKRINNQKGDDIIVFDPFGVGSIVYGVHINSEGETIKEVLKEPKINQIYIGDFNTNWIKQLSDLTEALEGTGLSVDVSPQTINELELLVKNPPLNNDRFVLKNIAFKLVKRGKDEPIIPIQLSDKLIALQLVQATVSSSSKKEELSLIAAPENINYEYSDLTTWYYDEATLSFIYAIHLIDLSNKLVKYRDYEQGSEGELQFIKEDLRTKQKMFPAAKFAVLCIGIWSDNKLKLKRKIEEIFNEIQDINEENQIWRENEQTSLLHRLSQITKMHTRIIDTHTESIKKHQEDLNTHNILLPHRAQLEDRHTSAILQLIEKMRELSEQLHGIKREQARVQAASTQETDIVGTLTKDIRELSDQLIEIKTEQARTRTKSEQAEHGYFRLNILLSVASSTLSLAALVVATLAVLAVIAIPTAGVGVLFATGAVLGAVAFGFFYNRNNERLPKLQKEALPLSEPTARCD